MWQNILGHHGHAPYHCPYEAFSKVGDYDLVEEGSLAEEIEASDEYRKGLYAALVRIDECCDKVKGPATPPTLATPRTDTPTGVESIGSTASARVKLPKLNIHPFGGDLTAWITFWDSYKAAIHENSSLSEIDKFNYLRPLLKSSALDAISGLTLTATNYREAIEILEKRFGNRQQIVAKHMDALLKIDGVTSHQNVQGLRHLYDQVESHVRSLKALGVSSDSYGTLLASVLIGKLPQEMQLIVTRKVGGDDWKLDALLKLVEEELQARERAAAISATLTKKSHHTPPTGAGLLAGGSGGKGPPTCSYCRQQHSSNSCGVVTQPGARKRVLQKSGKCFVCLRKGHISRDCTSTMKCYKCSGRHHVSICSKDSNTGTTRGNPPAAPTPANSSESTTPGGDRKKPHRIRISTLAPQPTRPLLSHQRPICG